VEVHAT
jgi:hypothetical protein